MALRFLGALYLFLSIFTMSADAVVVAMDVSSDGVVSVSSIANVVNVVDVVSSASSTTARKRADVPQV